MNDDALARVILIVDDHAEMCLALRDLLNAKFPQFATAEALTGRAAMEQVRALRPQLILMDIHLPDASGLELTRRAKALLPHTSVIVLSSADGLAYQEHAQAAGALGFVAKDKIVEDLLPLAAHALRLAAL